MGQGESLHRQGWREQEEGRKNKLEPRRLKDGGTKQL